MSDSSTLMAYTQAMSEEDRKLVSSLGKQVTLWCFDCDPAKIDDADRLCSEMVDYIDNNNLTVRDRCISKYEPQGVTIALILEESHLMVNTWPEHGVLQIELFACTEINKETLEKIAREVFGAGRVYAFKYE
ncbi:MAG TPA: hypothetical protein DCM54_09020 [Gammaproteobacteria bacterium]|nr:hypothetical protein [Gammaproteobacteria bacterium]